MNKCILLGDTRYVLRISIYVYHISERNKGIQNAIFHSLVAALDPLIILCS